MRVVIQENYENMVERPSVRSNTSHQKLHKTAIKRNV